MVRAGRSDRVVETSWGLEITIADPLCLYGDVEEGIYQYTSRRRPSRLRRLIAYLLLVPDPTIIWARRAAHHPLVLKHAGNSSWVLSSNPPESSHVGSYLLANRLRSRLIIDMRDGWLDEPLQPMLKEFSLQRWRQGRLERRTLQSADHVLVTSPVWKELLEKRLPFTKGKITVLYNACPLAYGDNRVWPVASRNSARLDLVHAGRFTGSRNTRRPKFLLEVLLAGVRSTGSKGKVTFIGSLEPRDIEELEFYREQFMAQGWEVLVEPAVSREELSLRLMASDGLLLLTVAPPTIPLKFFDYLAARKPVLAVTPRDGAVWQGASALPQFFLVDSKQVCRDAITINNFFHACAAEKWPCEVPSEFTEEQLSQRFLEILRCDKT